MGIILTSFTGHKASGGVPRWVRDFMKGFSEAKSYCWQDLLDVMKPTRNVSTDMPEWTKADILNNWLVNTGRRKPEDIIIGDGWWAGRYYPDRTISVCHGIWSHLIKEEADVGLPPDNPYHHREQVSYRDKSGAKLVAVSQFIQHQMDIQFGFKSEVINNAIDLEKFKPVDFDKTRDRPLIVHGVNDRGNKNKGWDHIQHLIDNVDATVLSLDEVHQKYGTSPNKYETLAIADLVVIPSGYEGNSYFALETLSCNIPIVAYDVGLFYELKKSFAGSQRFIGVQGVVMDRQKRSKEMTLTSVQRFLGLEDKEDGFIPPRDIAGEYSIQNFHRQWKEYLKKEFDYGC